MNSLNQHDLTTIGSGELASVLGSSGGGQVRVKAGYVDVLGEVDPIGPHRGQQIFRTRMLVKIYERLWRPIVTRYFFGFRGLRAAEEIELSLEKLELSAGDRVIDVGCGPGNYTRRLADAAAGGLVVGIDASEAMVAAAAKQVEGRNLAYVRGDASALPFGDGEFDGACCVGVIHMIEQPMDTLDEMVRVLAPGGRLVIMASCAREGAPGRVSGGLTLFARDELTNALKERGLVDVQQQIVRRAQFVSARKGGE